MGWRKMAEVMLAKLTPPRKDKDVIEQPRLLRLLSDFENRKATLLLAPAGYGKTIAMLKLAESAGRALVWYHLNGYDNDPRFLFSIWRPVSTANLRPLASRRSNSSSRERSSPACACWSPPSPTECCCR